jgi:hypothetical protein
MFPQEVDTANIKHLVLWNGADFTSICEMIGNRETNSFFELPQQTPDRREGGGIEKHECWQAGRQAGTNAGRQAGTNAGRQAGRQAGRKIGRHECRQEVRQQAGRQSFGRTERHECRKAGRQASRKKIGRHEGRIVGRQEVRQQEDCRQEVIRANRQA